jgi:hypothetical protein
VEFVSAVEAGSFAAAAAKLNLLRVAVGMSVARPVARLGVRLCHRTTRALALTRVALHDRRRKSALYVPPGPSHWGVVAAADLLRRNKAMHNGIVLDASPASRPATAGVAALGPIARFDSDFAAGTATFARVGNLRYAW